MNKLLSAVALAAAMLSTQAFAQNDTTSDTRRDDARQDDTRRDDNRRDDNRRGDSRREDDNMPVVRKPVFPQNTITTAPTNLLGGVYSIEYERALTTNLSAFVSPSIVNFLNLTTGFRLNGGVRLFVGSEAPSGFFVAPQLIFDYGSSTNFRTDTAGSTVGTQVYTTWSVGAGLMVGYTLLLGNVFDISLGFGGGGQYTNVSLGASTGTGALPPAAGLNAFILPRANIGFAF